MLGSESQLITAVANLLENAIAYSPDDTKVALAARKRSESWEITVTDQGIGIPPEDLDRVFERFYRVDPARSRETGGTGLGLAIVKHIVNNHGGHVRVWSSPGSGSTFTLSYRHRRKARDDAGAGRRGRGLVLRRAVVPAAQGGLRGLGRRRSGPAALEEFDRAGADIVLLDLMLPGLSGLEVCRELRKRSDVAVVMLTAKDGEVDKVVGLELGADDYVTKPFCSRELVARLRAVLRRRGQPVGTRRRSSRPARCGSIPIVTSSASGGAPTSLPLKEFELLEVLLRNAGRVLTREQLMNRVWGADYFGDTKTLDVHVKRLRAKIEPDPSQPRHLVTIRGVGYRFDAAVSS